MFNYELYKVFYYVAKYLSFSKAASKLYISQSAVSQNIKSLE
ncbi:MAG: helix-turn-helix domain-containing protein, partial [Bacillota bacterium]